MNALNNTVVAVQLKGQLHLEGEYARHARGLVECNETALHPIGEEVAGCRAPSQGTGEHFGYDDT